MSSRGRASGLIRATCLAALFFSGLAGLMHEVVWARLLVTLIGNSARSNTIVLGVFMGGLALGAVLFGKRADRTRRPLVVYAWLELFIGLYALALPWLFQGTSAIYETLASTFFERELAKLLLRLCMAVAIILLPALAMGATLPILARELVANLAQTSREVGLLYAVNNLGAVLGAGLAGFWALPRHGIAGSTAVAFGANVLAAAAALGCARAFPASAREEEEPPASAANPSRQPAHGAGRYAAAIAALFLAGFAALAYEVCLLRMIALAFGSSTYSFTVMLMCFISGIGLGSALLSGLPARAPLLLFGGTQLLVALSFMSVAPLIERLPFYVGRLRVGLQDEPFGFELYLAGQAGLCLLVLLVPTMCMGFGFPLVSQLQTRSAAHVGASVGSTYAWNTLGNVLGALITGLFLLPHFGLAASFRICLALSLLSALLCLVFAAQGARWWRSCGLALGAIAFLLHVAYGGSFARTLQRASDHLRLREGPPSGATPVQWASHPTTSFSAWKRAFVVDEEACERFEVLEDEQNNVLAYQQAQNAWLVVNGKGDASSLPGDMINQVLLGQLPMLIADAPRRALVIGYGSGVTLGSVALNEELEAIDLVELSPAVLAAHPVFASINYDVLRDRRVKIEIDDARTFLRTSPYRYDVIISEPSNPWIAGIGNLFTVEFFEEARKKLEPGGILCVWIHLYELGDLDVQLVLRTLQSALPHVEIFMSNFADVICLASNEAIEPDFDRLEARFYRGAIQADLARVSVRSLASLLAHHALPGVLLREALEPGPLNTDRMQRLEFEAPRRHFAGATSGFLTDLARAGAEARQELSWLERYLRYRGEKSTPLKRSEIESLEAALAASLFEPAHPLRTAVRAAAVRASE